ncbi:MAG TPA: hypothetical protein VF543_15635 [Pyrinomonadaceae bacterium]|jgi:hypothetical protein
MTAIKFKPFVFVLMPFSKQFDDIYQLGIRSACIDAGAYCERVDEQIFVENILERLYNQIAKADLIVAEMTGRNANVFYEVGYAHALKKQVILLTQNAEDIPFDLKHYPHIVYEGSIVNLKEQLEIRVRWIIDNPPETLSKVDLNLDFFIDGVSLTNAPIIEHPDRRQTDLKIDMYNPTGRLLSSGDFSLALMLPAGFKIVVPYDIPYALLPSGHLIYKIEPPSVLFPDEWSALTFTIQNTNEKYQPSPIILRVFTELGPKDYQLSLVYMGRAKST